jgi:predicted DNA-binding WGR domain protein
LCLTNRHKAKKFWEIELAGNSYITVAGVAGTQGKTTTKKFASKVEAQNAYLRVLSSAFTRGYREEVEAPAVWQAFADWDVAAVGEFLRADPALAKFRGPEGRRRFEPEGLVNARQD